MRNFNPRLLGMILASNLYVDWYEDGNMLQVRSNSPCLIHNENNSV